MYVLLFSWQDNDLHLKSFLSVRLHCLLQSKLLVRVVLLRIKMNLMWMIDGQDDCAVVGQHSLLSQCHKNYYCKYKYNKEAIKCTFSFLFHHHPSLVHPPWAYAPLSFVGPVFDVEQALTRFLVCWSLHFCIEGCYSTHSVPRSPVASYFLALDVIELCFLVLFLVYNNNNNNGPVSFIVNNEGKINLL